MRRDVDAEMGEGLRQFEADGAQADHGKAPG
jgi:hypothetical protein